MLLSRTSGWRFEPARESTDRQMAEIRQFIFDLYGEDDGGGDDEETPR